MSSIHLARSEKRLNLAETRLTRVLMGLIREMSSYLASSPRDTCSRAHRQKLRRYLRNSKEAIKQRKKLEIVGNRLIMEAEYCLDENPNGQAMETKLQRAIDNASLANEKWHEARGAKEWCTHQIECEQTLAKGAFQLLRTATWNNTKLVPGEYRFSVLSIPKDNIGVSVECGGSIRRFIAHAREWVGRTRTAHEPTLHLHVDPGAEAEVVKMDLPGPYCLRFFCKHNQRNRRTELRREVVPLKYDPRIPDRRS